MQQQYVDIINRSAQFITSSIGGGAKLYSIPYDAYELNRSVDVYLGSHNIIDEPNVISAVHVSFAHIATPMLISMTRQ
jgi:hypothetical protein